MFDPSNAIKKMLGPGINVPRYRQGKSTRDSDGDGINDIMDCQPKNMFRQDEYYKQSESSTVKNLRTVIVRRPAKLILISAKDWGKYVDPDVPIGTDNVWILARWKLPVKILGKYDLRAGTKLLYLGYHGNDYHRVRIMDNRLKNAFMTNEEYYYPTYDKLDQLEKYEK